MRKKGELEFFVYAPPKPGDSDYENLKQRMGEELLRKRIDLQAYYWVRQLDKATKWWGLRKWMDKDLLFELFIRLSGLYSRGNQNCMKLQLLQNEAVLKDLPPAFEGYRILQISDLHLDLEPALAPIILETISGLDYDLVVINGDYRDATTDLCGLPVALTAKVLEALKAPVYGILGNHDFVEMVPALERAGLRILLNETVPIRREEDTLYLSGIDDPSCYGAHSFPAVAKDIPEGSCSVLLSHSPSIYRQAVENAFSLVLCGHTHGGQVCLPGGIPVRRNGQCPSFMLSGSWEYKGAQGSPSGGVGPCGVAVRFF